MTLEALVFDLDGTFVDTDELHRRAFNQAFLEFELGFEWKPDVYEKLLTVSGGADRIRHFIEGCPLSPEQKLALHAVVPAVHREKTRIYGELLESNAAKLRSGVRRLMAEARQADLKIGVVATSASVNMQPLILAVLGREGASDIRAFVSADRVTRKKPAPDIYLLAASMLGVSPERCVAFEDFDQWRARRESGRDVHDRDAEPMDPRAGFLARGCLPERTRRAGCAARTGGRGPAWRRQMRWIGRGEGSICRARPGCCDAAPDLTANSVNLR